MGNEFRTPATTTAPVEDTTAGLFTFSPGASRLFLHNRTGQLCYVRFNGAAASVATHDFVLADGVFTNLKAEDLGVGTFDTVSVWMAADAVEEQFNIRGV